MSAEFLDFCETLHLNPTEELWQEYQKAEKVNDKVFE